MTITTNAELGEALKNNKDYIEIEGDLAKNIITIKATGSVAWVIAFGAITVAVVGILAIPPAAPPLAVAKLAATTTAIPAVSILGISATISAISIAVAVGSVSALNKLRDYRLEKISNTRVILHKK